MISTLASENSLPTYQFIMGISNQVSGMDKASNFSRKLDWKSVALFYAISSPTVNRSFKIQERRLKIYKNKCPSWALSRVQITLNKASNIREFRTIDIIVKNTTMSWEDVKL